MHIQTKEIHVEAANGITIVERYNQPILRAFKIIRKEAPDIEQDSALQMEVKSVNESVGTDGLVPTLLVYGALPRIGKLHDKPTSSTVQRANALRNATAEMSTRFAQRKVRDEMNTRNGPDARDVNSMTIGSHALVYRPKKDHWEAPYCVLEINGKEIMLLLPPPSGPNKFRSTVVKRYIDGNVKKSDVTVSVQLSTMTISTRRHGQNRRTHL